MSENTIHPGIALIVVMLDELVHTNEHPFCNDLSCPCHSDYEYNWEHLGRPWYEGLMTTDETQRLWSGRQV